MAQQTGRQYDDDLTVGADVYNESFSTEYIDLFEPLADNDAPIAKLKTIILSIDWEITNDILQQLHAELQDLKDVWVGNKINLIYLQALEKIGQYLFAEKAKAHPNAIKLLLTFYYDLEKIVTSVSMSEAEKKQLLLQDVKKFDQFKLQISSASADVGRTVTTGPVVTQPVVVQSGDMPPGAKGGQRNVLTNLKAIVLGIDWEISDKDLARLAEEVGKLEKIFSESRAKLIFLQGIGALGNYIRSTKSGAHLEAFKLLHSFYNGLERVYNEVLSSQQEKEILLEEVRKFNTFKAVIATVASEVVVPVEEAPSASIAIEEEEDEENMEGSGVVTPAFADVPPDVHGFREDAEAVQGDIDRRLASFLGEEEPATDTAVEAERLQEEPEISSRLEELFGEEDTDLIPEVPDAALAGVDVETEADDDSGEKDLPRHGGMLAPALAEAGGQSPYMEQAVSQPVVESVLEDVGAISEIPGVDVETEADDDSEEAALPRYDDEVAPALAFADEEKGFCELEIAAGPDEEEFDLEDRLDSFFGAEIEEASQGAVICTPDDDEQEPAEPSVLNEGVGFHLTEPLYGDAVEESLPETPAALNELFTLEDEAGKEESIWPDSLQVDAEPELPEPAIAFLSGEESSTVDAAPSIVETEVAVIPESGAPCAVESVDEEVWGRVASEGAEVIFEPVGDDVEVDVLPDMTGRVVFGGVSDGGFIQDVEFAQLKECVSRICAKNFDEAFPYFSLEVDRLLQDPQIRFAGKMLLQLIRVVGQYINRCPAVTDIDLRLLQSLMDTLEKMSTTRIAFDTEMEQTVYDETVKVLLWQQGLIPIRSEEQTEEGDLFAVADEATDLFSKG